MRASSAEDSGFSSSASPTDCPAKTGNGSRFCFMFSGIAAYAAAKRGWRLADGCGMAIIELRDCGGVR